MTGRLLAEALAHASDTRLIDVSPDAVARTGEAFTAVFEARHAFLVADGTTWRLAGDAVTRALTGAGVTVEGPLLFDAEPPVYAGYENVARVRDALAATTAPAVSIGSGTINDLVKLASGELGRPYLHVCTAASMDGYASFGAAITRDGFKITRTCPAPVAVIADLDIMATAPARMTANGYGDLIEKYPGGADWIVADEVGIEPIDPSAWRLAQELLPAAMDHPDALVAGDRRALAALTEESMLSGLAIQAHQSSRPGSGAGHNFSHQWEMEGHGLDWNPPLSHGAKVGLGALCMAALYDRALLRDLDRVEVGRVAAGWLTREQNEQRVRDLQDIPAIAAAAVAQSDAKYLPPSDVPQRVHDIRAAWPRIRQRVASQVLSAEETADRLRRVGAVRHPHEIDISMEKLRRTYFQAQTIRSRYTLLDLLFEVGLLEELVDEVFGPDGYWGRHPEPS